MLAVAALLRCRRVFRCRRAMLPLLTRTSRQTSAAAAIAAERYGDTIYAARFHADYFAAAYFAALILYHYGAFTRPLILPLELLCYAIAAKMPVNTMPSRCCHTPLFRDFITLLYPRHY